MSMVVAAGAAAQAQAIRAIKASGTIVSVTPSEFQRILTRTENPLVVTAMGGFWKTKYQYLTSYRGFAFFTTSPGSLSLPDGTETIKAETIWIP